MSFITMHQPGPIPVGDILNPPKVEHHHDRRQAHRDDDNDWPDDEPDWYTTEF